MPCDNLIYLNLIVHSNNYKEHYTCLMFVNDNTHLKN